MKYFVDSDFLISLYDGDDFNHSKADDIFRSIKGEIIVSNLVLFESVTVISKKFGMRYARDMYKMVSSIVDEVLFVGEGLFQIIWDIFLNKDKKGTSFIDCSNLVLVQEKDDSKILSFDKFYPKQYRLVV